MQGQEATGPFCQSCGMPLQSLEDFGTAADGLKADDYCRFCYQSGAFTNPELDLQAMIERTPDFDGRKQAIPTLKRWQDKKLAGR